MSNGGREREKGAPNFFIDNVSDDGKTFDLVDFSNVFENGYDGIWIVGEADPISVEEDLGFFGDFLKVELD